MLCGGGGDMIAPVSTRSQNDVKPPNNQPSWKLFSLSSSDVIKRHLLGTRQFVRVECFNDPHKKNKKKKNDSGAQRRSLKAQFNTIYLKMIYDDRSTKQHEQMTHGQAPDI